MRTDFASPLVEEMQPSSETHGRDLTCSMFSPLFLREGQDLRIAVLMLCRPGRKKKD